ncbi:DNA polymerase [bacterium]|nr:DNA polymerase [bacterium]
MKLSENTFNILKNFAGINQSISVKSGNTLRTISVAENIFAVANVEEKFPRNFSLYDLNEFLGGMSLMKNAEMIFDDGDFVRIKTNRSQIKYFFSDDSLIKQAPNADIKLPDEDVQFSLTEADLNSVIRAASVYQLPDFSVIGDGEEIHIVARDKENDTSNTFSIAVGNTKEEFVFNLKVENIKLLKGDYHVSISKELISKFIHQSIPLVYYIALEPDSN